MAWEKTAFLLSSFIAATTPLQALALDDKKALEKMNVVAVFLLVNSNGSFYVRTINNRKIITAYLDKSDANKQKLDLQSSSKKASSASIIPYSLGNFLQKIKDTNAANKNKSLAIATYIKPSASNASAARTILKSEGIKDTAAIENQYPTPVFFTEPMISPKVKPLTGKKLFFVNHDELKQAISKLQSKVQRTVKIRTSNLQSVIKRIEREPKDIYAFWPTKEYLELYKTHSKR